VRIYDASLTSSRNEGLFFVFKAPRLLANVSGGEPINEYNGKAMKSRSSKAVASFFDYGKIASENV
jgi:hypothetical protein